MNKNKILIVDDEEAIINMEKFAFSRAGYDVVSAVTGYASLFEVAECREAGFEDYFVKPVNLKKLVKTAKNAFEKLNRWKTS